jgi:hypothetical protein
VVFGVVTFGGGDGDFVGLGPFAELLVVFEVAAGEFDVAGGGEAWDGDVAGVVDDGACGVPVGVGFVEFAVFDDGAVGVFVKGVPFEGEVAADEGEAFDLEDGGGGVGFWFGWGDEAELDAVVLAGVVGWGFFEGFLEVDEEAEEAAVVFAAVVNGAECGDRAYA